MSGPSRSSARGRLGRPIAYAGILALGLGILTASPDACAAEGTAKPEPEIVTLETGDPAPFAGDLYPPVVSIRWALALEAGSERYQLELKHTRERHTAALDGARKAAAVQARADARLIAALEVELVEFRAWYNAPMFWAVAGGLVVIAAGAIVALVWGSIPQALPSQSLSVVR